MWSQRPLAVLAIVGFVLMVGISVLLYVTGTPVNYVVSVIAALTPPLLLLLGQGQTMSTSTVAKLATDIAHAAPNGSEAETKAVALATRAKPEQAEAIQAAAKS